MIASRFFGLTSIASFNGWHSIARRPERQLVIEYLTIIRLFRSQSPDDLQAKIANFLTQRVAVESEQVGGPDLITPGCSQANRKQGPFDFLQYPVIETRRREFVALRK